MQFPTRTFPTRTFPTRTFPTRTFPTRTTSVLAGALLSSMVATVAQAETQGSIGQNSTGSISINATVSERIRISGLADVVFSNQELTSDAVASQNVCVWTNRRSNGYQLTATGSGTGDAFTLETGTAETAHTVPYAIEWADTANQNSGTDLSPGAAASGLTAGANNPNCSGGEGESLIVKITESNLQTMFGNETYTGTLTLTVAPS